jgi:hypothetical protein
MPAQAVKVIIFFMLIDGPSAGGHPLRISGEHVETGEHK